MIERERALAERRECSTRMPTASRAAGAGARAGADGARLCSAFMLGAIALLIAALLAAGHV